MKRTQHPSRRPWAFGLALVLACALLWAQALGLAHRMAHGPQGTGSHGLVQQTAAASPGKIASASLLASVFGAHQSDPDCRLFDQLGHADVLPGVPLLALPAFSPVLLLFTALESLSSGPVLAFQARGPPPTR